jgi:hypothetical protein
LPDGIFSNQKVQFWYTLVLNLGILRPFGV